MSKLATLRATPFFAALSSAAINELVSELVLSQLPGGEILFRAGDNGDAMYIVLSGRLRVSIERSDGTEEVIRELAYGESVGELALLTGEPRSATIRAIRDTELAMLSRSAFERAVAADPKLIRQIAVQLASRQHPGGERNLGRGNIRTVAIVPIDATAETNDFAASLTAALAAIGPIRLLSSERIKNEHGLEFSEYAAGPASEERLGAHLDALEGSQGMVIYQSDKDLTRWTQRCIRQADLILIVHCAGADSIGGLRGPIEDYLNSRAITARVELVLWHGSEFDPAASASKLTVARAATHHHVVTPAAADCARLARFITDRAIGLVLSGGGARGFAHIGVIRALEERGMPIDYIGGSSMGAVIAAQHASGWDWQTMARVNREEWPRCAPQKNYTLPLVALNSGRRMDEMLRRMFGAVTIQSLRTKYFCLSTNLTAGRAHIHQEGDLWKAVRASVSIPGIGPPAIVNGEILVDGGLVNNLPVDVMRKLCHGTVYAVDVSEQVEFRSKLSESYTVSGWKMLWQRLNPWVETPDIPNLLNTLYRTITVGGIRAIDSARSQADIFFTPPVSHFGVFEWSSIDRIIEAGYKYARQKLDAGEPFSP